MTDVPQFDPAAYGDELSADYDLLYPGDRMETHACVEFLAALAESHHNPSLLEFGIGTGRIALELHQRGLQVAGIDASAKMVASLRRKRHGSVIPVTIGDFLSARVEASFGVVAIVFNAVLDERGVPAQLAIFENAARHLSPHGFFVVETHVLSEAARDGSWTVRPRYVGEHHVELQMSRFDVESGMLERTLVHLRPDGSRFLSVRGFYSDPGALDVMAHVNGMTRIARYSSWNRDPFTAYSARHVTVYQLR